MIHTVIVSCTHICETDQSFTWAVLFILYKSYILFCVGSVSPNYLLYFRLHTHDSVDQLRKFLLTKFPPRHLRNIPGADDSLGTNFKTVQKLIYFYHTDRVSKEEQGLKYFVLCEEITKLLTSRYNRLKGCD